MAYKWKAKPKIKGWPVIKIKPRTLSLFLEPPANSLTHFSFSLQPPIFLDPVPSPYSLLSAQERENHTTTMETEHQAQPLFPPTPGFLSVAFTMAHPRRFPKKGRWCKPPRSFKTQLKSIYSVLIRCIHRHHHHHIISRQRTQQSFARPLRAT